MNIRDGCVEDGAEVGGWSGAWWSDRAGALNYLARLEGFHYNTHALVIRIIN